MASSIPPQHTDPLAKVMCKRDNMDNLTACRISEDILTVHFSMNTCAPTHLRSILISQ